MELQEVILRELLTERVSGLLQEKYKKTYHNVIKEREKHARNMEEQLSFLTGEQRAAVEVCLDDFIDKCGEDLEFLYQRGLEDGIRIMKKIQKL